MGIREIISAPRSPWQNPFIERMIGSIRRECTDRVIVLNEAHLTSVLRSYFEYYHNDRTHLSLEKDPPDTRPIQSRPAGRCKIIALPRIGGLHHRYEWRKAAWKLKSFWYQKHRTVFADLCSESTSIKDFTLNPSFRINLTVGISFNRCTEENVFSTNLPRINFCEGQGDISFANLRHLRKTAS